MATGSVSQPKIVQKLLVRTVILLFALAAMFAGYRYVESRHSDFNFGSSSAAGIIAAIKRTEDGSEAVLIEPDGTIKGTESYKPGVTDREPVWSPDGKFLYFVSDRTGNTLHVYRWNPDQPDAEARTVGSRGRTSPTFPADDVPESPNNMLIIGGGTVQSLEPSKRQTPQILPPATATISQSSGDDEQGGSEAQFESLYGHLGTSFSYARWCKGNQYIAAIMKRDGGEVLVVQNMTPKEDGKLPPIEPVVAGDHVAFDINPKDGTIVFAIQGFQWPDPTRIPDQFKKGNHVTTPFRHLVGFVDPGGKSPLTPIVATKDDANCFGSPAVSPDGSKLLVTAGPYDPSSQSLSPKALLSYPVQVGGASAQSKMVEGEVYEPSWSHDGKLIAFAMRTNGKRDIYTMHDDGTSQVNLTLGKGDFSNPLINPQVKAAATP
jgi:TolB protein